MSKTNNIDLYKRNRAERVSELLMRFLSGRTIKKSEVTNEFDISDKTFKRDLEVVREMYYQYTDADIVYNRGTQAYVPEIRQKNILLPQEFIVLSKILLESRALNQFELNQLLDKLQVLTPQAEKTFVTELIGNEKMLYAPLQHNKNLIDTIGKLSKQIAQYKKIKFDYTRMDGKNTKHSLKPLGIMFSEYYFYLVGLTPKGDETVIVYRVDRMDNIVYTAQTFTLEHNKRFQTGEFRKHVHFMYSGKPKTVAFIFSGPSIESVKDKFPTAKVTNRPDGKYDVSVMTYGNGIDFWLRSQGEWVEKEG